MNLPATFARLSTRPPPDLAAGAGFAILVNANAKRGGRRVAAQLERALPGASIKLTRTIQEIDGWLATLNMPRGILAAGGDGTAVALLGALARVGKHNQVPVGAVPLGTGNAWAHALGARKLHWCVAALAHSKGRVPTRRYTLFECDGVRTFFAGSGWDAQVLEDYKEQLAVSKGPLRTANKSVYGYISAMLTRTAPRSLMQGSSRVLIENLGDSVFVLGPDNEPVLAPGLGRGSVLCDGPSSVVGCATCPELGFRFKAFPHADRFPGLMNVRVYNQKTLRAIWHIPKIWKGEIPLEGMTDWFASHVRMTFSRPTPLQIAGESVGLRQSIEYKVAKEQVSVIDWRGFE